MVVNESVVSKTAHVNFKSETHIWTCTRIHTLNNARSGVNEMKIKHFQSNFVDVIFFFITIEKSFALYSQLKWKWFILGLSCFRLFWICVFCVVLLLWLFHCFQFHLKKEISRFISFQPFSNAAPEFGFDSTH